MGKEAVRAVVLELESLPEADQQRVVDFLALLKRRGQAPNAQTSISRNGSALAIKDGLLVFTGRVDARRVEWVEAVREERDEDLTRAAFG